MSRATSAVGLVPAAGRALRLRGLDGSKEIQPIGQAPTSQGGRRPKAVCEYLLDCFAAAGISCAYVVVRTAKRDIKTYLDARKLDFGLEYVEIEDSQSVPETLDQAFSEISGRLVALGFPDILLRPTTCFRHLLKAQLSSSADVVLGLFPTNQEARSDMVDIDPSGTVRRLRVKQPPVGLQQMWSIAVWTPRFTEYLHEHFPPLQRRMTGRELQVGDVIQAAIDDGLRVEGVPFADGESIDIGTAEGLQAALDRVALDRVEPERERRWGRTEPPPR